MKTIIAFSVIKHLLKGNSKPSTVEQLLLLFYADFEQVLPTRLCFKALEKSVKEYVGIFRYEIIEVKLKQKILD